MRNTNLEPTRVTSATGAKTTVYRKPETAPSKPLTTKARFINAAVALGISKAMSKRLAAKSEELDPAARTAMLSLMEQPDPHETVKTLLIEKFGKRSPALYPEGTDPYKTPDMERFASWVTHADHHLHAINAVARQLNGPEFAATNVKMTLAGMYLHESHGYTVDQYRDISLITVATSAIRVSYQHIKQDITTLEFMSPKNYEYLSSGLILDRITSSHDTAIEVLRLISDEHVLKESDLLHRIDNTPRALIVGTL